MVIITDGDRTYAMFNYPRGQLRDRQVPEPIRFGYEIYRSVREASFVSGTSGMYQLDQITGNSGMFRCLDEY